MTRRSKHSIGQLRRTHLGRQLFELNKAYMGRSIAIIQAGGFPEMTQGYLTVLSQIDIEGSTEMKELIGRVGTSKQAVSRTLLACEKLGLIRSEPLPSDQRGKRLRFTAKGEKLMDVAATAIEKTEAYFEPQVGNQKFATLKRLLANLAEQLDLIKVDR